MKCIGIPLPQGQYDKTLMDHICYYATMKFQPVLEKCIGGWTKERIMKSRNFDSETLHDQKFWQTDEESIVPAFEAPQLPVGFTVG